MGILEQILLDYYWSCPLKSLTAQEIDEYLYLELKLGLQIPEQTKRGTP